jgi:hypothetical protein
LPLQPSTASAVKDGCHRHPSMTNDNRWLLAIVVINCAAAMMIGGAAMVMAAATAMETTIN